MKILGTRHRWRKNVGPTLSRRWRRPVDLLIGRDRPIDAAAGRPTFEAASLCHALEAPDADIVAAALVAFVPLAELLTAEVTELMIDVGSAPRVGVAQSHPMREATLIVSNDARICTGHGRVVAKCQLASLRSIRHDVVSSAQIVRGLQCELY